MRNMIVIGWVLVSANTAIGANSIPFQAGGAAGAPVPSASAVLRDPVPWGIGPILQSRSFKRRRFCSDTPRRISPVRLCEAAMNLP